MNVLVAGGAGFIGCHLVDALILNGDDVVCVDNLFIGTKDNISHLRDHKHFTFYEDDICELAVLEKIFAKHDFDRVYHLAANSDIQASAKNPDIEYNNTLSTTYNLLYCMKKFKVNKVFFASTSAVYGEALKGSLSEDAGPLSPISYYGAAKLASESLISAFSHMNDFSALVFRFPNVLGSKLTHGVVFDFISKLKLSPKRLKILGDGTQSKPYMHVSSLVDGIMQLSKTMKPGVETYNIGVDTQTNVTKIADIIVEQMGLKDVVYDYTGGSIGWKGDVATFEYDLSKIKATGWQSRYTSDETVRKTVKEVL